MPRLLPTPRNGAAFARLRIGLLGGSFNPAHEGHRHISLVALHRLRLDAVWWLVSPGNPLKPSAGMRPLAARLASARQISAGHPQLLACNLETQLGTRFTIDLLRALRQRFARTRFVFLLGADNWRQLPRWKAWREIIRLVPLAVLRRPGYMLSLPHLQTSRCLGARHVAPAMLAAGKAPRWSLLAHQLHGGSATAIRARGDF